MPSCLDTETAASVHNRQNKRLRQLKYLGVFSRGTASSKEEHQCAGMISFKHKTREQSFHNVIYCNRAFTKLIVPKEGYRTLSTMPAREIWVGARLSNSCSPSVGVFDFTDTAVSVVFFVFQIYVG
jgi:hypothetical protein